MENLEQKIKELEDWELEIEKEKEDLLNKALRSSTLKNDDSSNIFLESRLKNIKSYLSDPLNVNDNLGYKDRPFKLSYSVLRAMGRQHLIKSIVITRTEQVTSFSDYTEDDQKIGWKIRKKKGIFEDKRAKEQFTDQEKREIEFLVNLIQDGGVNNNPWDDDFNDFLRKVTPDTLILDQLAFEVKRNKLQKPIGFVATDASTYRLSTSYLNMNPDQNMESVNGHYPYYVQLYNGLVRAEFYPWELCLGFRNPQTDIYNNGYGRSELEDMISLVTWMLYSDNYNGANFSKGSNPKGVFRVKNLQRDTLEEFKQQWRLQAKGVTGPWTIPMIGADEMEFINLQQNNKDMEFTSWQEYLLRIACAHYKIGPEEIGFYLSAGGQGNTIYDGNNEYKLQYSKDKGLYPLLKFIGTKINKLIIKPYFDGKYEFHFCGTEQENEKEGVDLDTAKLNGWETFNEIRERRNQPPLKYGDIPANGTYLQFMQSQMQQQQGNPFQQGAEMGSSNPFEGGEEGENSQNFGSFASNPFQGDDNEEEDGNPFLKDLNTFIDTLNKGKIIV